ncbi:MAG: OadG family protein [Opitutaceae bacterium]|jgi:hypothetical protein|nr:OadG family protein [Opitutaceae bacterium]
MTLAPSLLGTLPEYPSFLETIIYQLNGLIIVFVVLGSLWLLMELIGVWFKRRDAKLKESKLAAQEAKAAAAAPVPSTTLVPSARPLVTGAIAPEIIAVVTVAVHMVLDGRRHRVVSVSPAAYSGHAMPHSSAWAVEGRREIFMSHRKR